MSSDSATRPSRPIGIAGSGAGTAALVPETAFTAALARVAPGIFVLLWATGFAVVFVPLVIWYTSWAFWVMRGEVDARAIEHDDHAY